MRSSTAGDKVAVAALILSLPTWVVVIALIGLVAAMVYIFLVHRSGRD